MCLYVYMTLGCNVCGNVGRVFDVNGGYIKSKQKLKVVTLHPEIGFKLAYHRNKRITFGCGGHIVSFICKQWQGDPKKTPSLK